MKNMKKITALLIALVLILGLCACSRSERTTWREQYDLGVRYLSEGKYQEAIIAFTAAIEINPMRADAYIGLADAYEAQGDVGLALQVLADALDIVTDSAVIQKRLDGLEESSAAFRQEQYDLGIRYLSEGNYREAITAFTAVIKIDPRRAEAYVGRGDAYVGIAPSTEDPQASYDLAEADYLTALDLNMLLEEVYIKLADLYVTVWDLEKAIGILERAYEITHDDGILERIDALRIQPDLPDEFYDGDGAMIVTMYNAWGDFVGHDAYAFDDQGRMLSNIWYNQENEIQQGQSWEYDDAAGVTITVSFGSNYSGDPATLEGCEDRGWYWEYMGDFSTNPSLEAVDGIADLGGGKWVQYGYDGRGRVSSIYTYDQYDTLLGYCIVTYS